MLHNSVSPPLGILANPLFRSCAPLGDDDKMFLNDLGFDVRRYAPRTIIERQGEGRDDVFFIQSGWGSLFVDLAGGERQIVDFTVSGDVIGLGPDDRPASRSFMSVTDLVVFKVSARTIFTTFARSEKLAMVFGRAMERQRAILIQHLANLGRRNAMVRTAHFLLELGARLEAGGMATRDQFECPITQSDLADTLGLTTIHVNRVLRQLRERELLHFNRGHVEFLDRPALVRFSDFNDAYVAWDF